MAVRIVLYKKEEVKLKSVYIFGKATLRDYYFHEGQNLPSTCLTPAHTFLPETLRSSGSPLTAARYHYLMS